MKEIVLRTDICRKDEADYFKKIFSSKNFKEWKELKKKKMCAQKFNTDFFIFNSIFFFFFMVNYLFVIYKSTDRTKQKLYTLLLVSEGIMNISDTILTNLVRRILSERRNMECLCMRRRGISLEKRT